MNNYNPWLNRANELLDLSNDNREGQANSEEAGFIPQILMNPWDPQQVLQDDRAKPLICPTDI